MCALIFVNNSLLTKFEMPSFTCSKDMNVAPKFKSVSHDPDHAHLGDLSSNGYYFLWPTCVKFED